MTAEELLERYAAGERNFSGADLKGADLRGTNLSPINFENANLRNADLSGAIMHASMIGTDLEGAIFNGKEIKGLFCAYGAFYYYTIMPDGTTLVGPEYGR